MSANALGLLQQRGIRSDAYPLQHLIRHSLQATRPTLWFWPPAGFCASPCTGSAEGLASSCGSWDEMPVQSRIFSFDVYETYLTAGTQARPRQHCNPPRPLARWALCCITQVQRDEIDTLWKHDSRWSLAFLYASSTSLLNRRYRSSEHIEKQAHAEADGTHLQHREGREGSAGLD